jgi:ABC-type uncharacterized transport system involved in gliding motility auxiliary subunit
MMNMLRVLLKYLYLPGIFLAIAGLVARLVTLVWTPLYIGLLAAGVVLLVLWLAYVFYTAQGFWQQRSTQIGTNALVSTISLVAILALVNFLALRYSVRLDLTENQLLTLSSQSQEIVKELKQPLKVFVFDKDPSQGDRELLTNYRRYNDNFSFEFVDPALKPGLVKQFNVKSIGDVFVEYRDKKQLAQNLINVNFQQKEPLSESKLTNAIEKVQRDRTQTIYFLQGHGEYALKGAGENSIAAAVSSLEEKGYKVEGLNLAQRATIPDDVSAIVIAGAKRKFFDPEVKALKAYSDRGGSLFLAIDPETELGLEPLLKEWGVQLDRRIVLDASGNSNSLGYGPETPIVTSYGDHPITEDFSNEYSLYPLARPIATLKAEGVNAVALIRTNEQMWAESDVKSDPIEFDPKQDVSGPFDLGVALTRNLEAGENKQQKESTPSPSPENFNNDRPKKSEARMVAIGNSTFATDSLFQDPRVLNGDLFLNSVQWLASDDDRALSIRPKEPKNRRINLSPLQANALGWMSSIIVPFLGLGFAGLTWWRRR